MAKKQKEEGLRNKLALIMKRGKVTIGFKNVLRALNSQKVHEVFVTNNLSPLKWMQLQYYRTINKFEIVKFNGNNNELGSACGKLFQIGCLAVLDYGSAEGTAS